MAAKFRGRVAALLALVVALIALTVSGAAHGALVALIERAEPLAARHAVLGAVVFAALAALSAMFMFVSSLLLVPIGVSAWGNAGCFALLWVGWFAGGVLTYSIGRHLGRPAVRRMLSPKAYARYERAIPPGAPFSTALLVQLSVPSDIAGYFFGLLAYPRNKYLAALAVAELPYAVGAVYLGSAFVERNTGLLATAGVAMLAVAAWQWWRAHVRRARPGAADR